MSTNPRTLAERPRERLLSHGAAALSDAEQQLTLDQFRVDTRAKFRRRQISYAEAARVELVRLALGPMTHGAARCKDLRPFHGAARNVAATSCEQRDHDNAEHDPHGLDVPPARVIVNAWDG